MAKFELTSPAFEHGQPIPRKHTCEGEDVWPPLIWSGVPEGTASLALVVARRALRQCSRRSRDAQSREQ